ncbi:cation diffusion facilitator family transporter [Aureibaculum sp. 2210JD6-5]|uniref:cation diffusion facilitator family transporter n=1 Tax=Aureibaculum sp. 2210JD6-5 TaxID=3103957 RepID=UPI002AAE0405|nr:cation diffusion facilitator family transporter [Aureibaculum sp. 2210JD6-5]MDY7396344.1 cation diffusion facilitator family transporter [Aureibaculum sp. 2210JD6-5]
MAHQHGHHHNTGNIKVAFFLNLVFTIIEFIGGIYTNSLAIMSDALHDLGDSLSLGLSWYFQKLSNKGATKKFSYGYKRFSLLGAIINSIVLVVGSVFIIKEAIPGLVNPQQVNAKGMMWLAILGILVNGAAVFKLKQGTSMNERVVSLHLLEDVLGWAAVLIASIVMQFWDIPILDPILSLLIAAFILFNVFKNIKETLRIILQGTPKQISVEAIRNQLKNMPEINEIHDCHVWSLDGEYNLCSLHVSLNDSSVSINDTQSIKQKIRKLLHDDFEIEHVTLELESSNEDCEYKDGC